MKIPNAVIVALVSIFALTVDAESAITKEYIERLKKDTSFEVSDYEDSVFKGFDWEEIQKMFQEDTHEKPSYPSILDSVDPDPNLENQVFDWSATCEHEILEQGSKCPASWAFAAVGMVSRRCCMKGKDYGWLSVQELISCDAKNYGCIGGDEERALDYVKSNGLVPKACFGYKQEKVPCPSICDDKKTLWKESHICHCKNVRACAGDAGFKYCLATGPIAAGMTIYKDFLTYKGGIYAWDKKSPKAGVMSVEVVGEGTEKNVSYWKCAVSFGTSWGEKGYARIKKKENSIETHGAAICDIV